MKYNQGAPRVFLFPYFAYGHISPFLELAKRLSERGFYIYLCSTPVNLKSIEKRLIVRNSSSHLAIQLVEIHLPELLPQYQTTNGLPVHLIPTLNEAIKMAKPSLSKILKAVNPDLIIYDQLLQWAAAEASKHNIPAIQLFTSSVVDSYLYHLSQSPGIEFPLPGLDFLHDQHNFHKLIEYMSKGEDEIESTLVDDQYSSYKNFILLKTSREMEGKYINYVSDVMKTKVIPVGLLVQEPNYKNIEGGNMELIEWLGNKNENSSVFISFGTEVFLNTGEIEEIAFGLELSGVNFIWVIRFQKDKKAKATLPDGFLERIGDKGRIVNEWAPQADILSHPSIGGFVSHCGWNSTLESLEFGIPLICMPMQFDQPLNAKFIVEIGIGVEVIKDIDNKFQRKEIAKAIKDVLAGEKAERMRKHVRDVRDKVKLREKEEIDEGCQLLARICEEKQSREDLSLSTHQIGC